MINLFEGKPGIRETQSFIEEKLCAGIWRWEIASDDMECSPGFFKLLGMEPAARKLSFHDIQQMVHPEDRLATEELAGFLYAGTPLDHECRIIRPNGRIRWISNRIEALFDSGGRVTHAIGVSVDVTKQREQLQSMKNSAARFEALLEAIDGKAWIVNHEGAILRSLKEGPGNEEKPAFLLCGIDSGRAEDRAYIEEQIRCARTTLHSQAFEYRASRADGTIGWMRTIVTPVKDDHRQIQEWVYVSTDVSLQRQYLPDDAAVSPLTGAQIRGARGILAMSVRELADAANVSPSAIRRYEETNGINAPEPPLTNIRAELVARGIEFIFPKAGEPGVRLRQNRKAAIELRRDITSPASSTSRRREFPPSRISSNGKSRPW
ncbi:MAG: PAS domain-containing protein [Xanthobacteraceae bacterium]